MQAIMETGFDILYLGTVIALGILMMRKAGKRKNVLLFGVMAVTLGCGDAFHLVPRAYALCTDGLAAHVVSLGIGKLITSVTMTVFYVLLFHVWEMRYEQSSKQLRIGVYGLAALRVLLCLFPQNGWIRSNPSPAWGIFRNIPFAVLGILMIVLFYQQAGKKKDKIFSGMWLAITLSFGFYIPVVLWADAVPLVGMLMIPKTLAYVWVVWMGYRMMKEEN